MAINKYGSRKRHIYANNNHSYNTTQKSIPTANKNTKRENNTHKSYKKSPCYE